MDPSHAHEQLRLVRSLFPALALSLDDALLSHGDTADGAGRTQGNFDAWLDDEAARLRSGALRFAPFSGLDTGTAELFERAFTAAHVAAQHLGVAVPEPETFAAAGTDFAHLGERLRADPSLLPVPAPYGLGAARWQDAFRREANTPQSPFTTSSDQPEALVFATEAVSQFAQLDARDGEGAPTVVTGDRYPTPITWTLRLIPAGEKPALLGLGFGHGPHVTLPEILMVQLMRRADGLAPIDSTSFTWLAGSLADGRLAARHVFDEREGVIRVSCREIGNQGPHLGARPPIG